MPTAWRERRGSKFIVRYRATPGGPKKTAGTFPSAPLADEEVARIEGRMVGQPTYPGELVPLMDLVRAYVKARTTEEGMSEGNGVSCITRIEHHAKAQKWATVADITPKALLKWRETSKHTTGAWRYLRAVLRWAAFYADQPVDSRLLVRLPRSGKPGRQNEAALIPDQLAETALARSKDLDASAHALLYWLALLGPRPISLFLVEGKDINLKEGRAKIRHNKNRTPFEHALPDALLEKLRPLVEKCKPGERLFKDPRTGKPWELSKIGTADKLGQWYRVYVSHDFPKEYRGPYVLKDWAQSRMEAAGVPRADIILFSGQADEDTLDFYQKSNVERSRIVLNQLPTIGKSAHIAHQKSAKGEGRKKQKTHGVTRGSRVVALAGIEPATRGFSIRYDENQQGPPQVIMGFSACFREVEGSPRIMAFQSLPTLPTGVATPLVPGTPAP